MTRIALLFLAACVTLQAVADEDRRYQVLYRLDLTAAPDARNASIEIGTGAANFRELRMDFDSARFSAFAADGDLVVADGALTWRPPREGGRLRYRAEITHRRLGAGYDARVSDGWALFRGNDVFPAAATRTLRGARAEAELEFVLPAGWSTATRYVEAEGDDRYVVANEGRRFSRPSGWMLAGRIGVRRSLIADRRVVLAAPVDEGFRRMDIMAFLNWTLPELTRIFRAMDERLIIVGAGDPMWRGGLSGPGSLFIHAARPLISENGTSTLLHELVHVGLGIAGSRHDDWVVEGLAEYYAVKILNQSGTLSERRGAIALESLADWGAEVDDLFLPRASGEVTARAVTVLAALDAELRLHAPERGGLDAVVAELAGADYTYEALCEAVKKVFLLPTRALAPENVPGATDVAACSTK